MGFLKVFNQRKHLINTLDQFSSYLKYSKMSSGTFVGKIDSHRAVIVSSENEKCQNLEEFAVKLEASLNKWKTEKLRSVWFKVNLKEADWISVLAKNGFTVHHGKGELVSLVKWLATNEKNTIPPYAHNLVGAGAVVLNDKDEILVVREKYSDYSHWKLPGGYVEPFEDIGDAAQREVLEETSIKTEFVSLLAFRHNIKANFDCSDLYFIVLLKPLTLEITREECEVDDCQWMNINEYVNHPNVHETNKMFMRTFIENRKQGIAMSRQTIMHPFSKRPQQIYLLSKT